MIDILKKLKIEKIISEQKYEDPYPVGSSPAILYSHAKNPKPVKDGLLHFWSILSAIGKPTYKLSIIFLPLLTLLTLNEYAIKDSFSFAEELSFDKEILSNLLYRSCNAT